MTIVTMNLDPGNKETAYVLLNSKRQILAKGYVKNEDMEEVFKEYYYDKIIIEMIACYGMPVGAEVFETCVWIGRYMQLNPDAIRVFRKDIKIEICGSMKAKDGNVRQALIDIYGVQGTKKNPGNTFGISGDIWAALAVGEYYIRTVERGLKLWI